MYVAAHRVRSKAGEVGINALLHLHRDQPIPMRSAGEPDLDAITTLEGGYLVAQSTEVRPGGNHVEAHLDLVAPDDAAEDVLARTVGEVRVQIGPVSRPVTVIEQGVAARFGAIIAFDGRPDDLREVLDGLWQASRALLDRRQGIPPPVRGPYVVWAEPAADGVRLWLPPATLARLPRSVRRRSRALLPAHVMAVGQPAELLREMALVLLDVDDAAIAGKGGIEIVEPRTGAVLATFTPTVIA